MSFFVRSARQRSCGGFSQVELAVAILVLAVGILGVFASFAYGMQSTSHSARVSEAVGHARQLVEVIRSRNMPFQTPLPPPVSSGLADPQTSEWSRLKELNAPPFANDLPANSGFRRRVRVHRVSTDPTDYRYEIAEIQVTLFWREKDRQRQVEMTAAHRQP